MDSSLEELSHDEPLVTAHSVGVASESDWTRLARDVEHRHRRVDLLIDNAGISASAPFEQTSAEGFERILCVNFAGAVLGCRAFLPLLRKQPGARILNVASSFAWIGFPGKTAYAASKGALRAFSESLRHDCAADGVGVTVLYPGPLPTAIVRDGIAESAAKRDAEDRFLARRGLPLDAVARRTLDQWRRNPARIVIGWDYRLLDWIARVSPEMAGRVIGWSAPRVGF